MTDQPPAEWVEKATDALIARPGDRVDREGLASRALAAVWPLVQATVRDAKVEIVTRFIELAERIRSGPMDASTQREVALEIQSLCREVLKP